MVYLVKCHRNLRFLAVFFAAILLIAIYLTYTAENVVMYHDEYMKWTIREGANPHCCKVNTAMYTVHDHKLVESTDSEYCSRNNTPVTCESVKDIGWGYFFNNGDLYHAKRINQDPRLVIYFNINGSHIRRLDVHRGEIFNMEADFPQVQDSLPSSRVHNIGEFVVTDGGSCDLAKMAVIGEIILIFDGCVMYKKVYAQYACSGKYDAYREDRDYLLGNGVCSVLMEK